MLAYGALLHDWHPKANDAEINKVVSKGSLDAKLRCKSPDGDLQLPRLCIFLNPGGYPAGLGRLVFRTRCRRKVRG